MTPFSIVVFVPNWLGDAAMCTPALRALRKHFPDALITIAGRKSVCSLLDGLPYSDNVLELPPRPGPLAMLSLRRRLARGGFDMAVIFPHSFRAAFLALVMRARARIGYARGLRSFILTQAVAPHRENGRITPIYMGREYLGLLEPLGIKDYGGGLELVASDRAVDTVCRALPTGDGPIVGIAPGAAFGPSKLWPPERFAAVVDALTERVGARCIIVTGPGEEDTRRAVMSAARCPIVEIDGGSPNIESLKAAVSQMDLLICNDTGPRHVAVAFQVPVVCIMGPTSPRYSEGPYERGRVLRIDVDCGPCQKPECVTDHRCMTGVSVASVVDVALEFIHR